MKQVVLNFPYILLQIRSPAASRIRAKILYATSKQGLRRVLEGVHYEMQATDPSEMGFDLIRERAQ
jgi:cofilin